MKDFNNSDWILFKSKIVGWQEAYMEKLNAEYLEILNSDSAASHKFWELEKRICNDRHSIGVQIEMTRSKLLSNIIALLDSGIVTAEDLNGFSDELKNRISKEIL